jgi:hypothetical protein
MDPNPYAPSAVVDPRQELAEAGVGAWRDGDLLVIHRDARLPEICLKTGQPAGRRLTVKLAWDEHWWSLRKQTLRLELPLSERSYFAATRLRWLLVALGMAVLAALGVIIPRLHHWPSGQGALVIFGGGSSAITLLLCSVALGEPVAIRRVRGDYLWLSGAGQRFLQQLPVWRMPE